MSYWYLFEASLLEMTQNFSEGASQTVTGWLMKSTMCTEPWEDDRGDAFLRQLEEVIRDVIHDAKA